ncbi:hypothetical protein PC121_g24399, partial [Phytophthora cactorum]
QLMKLRSALRGQFILELNELDLKEIQRTFDDDDEDDDTEEIGHDSSAALGATKKELSGAIRAATIDNFQGEEATVILASLVRSSTNVHGRGTIGFLKTPNRINVLLSRAKHGLILVGHGELLRAKSPLWQKQRVADVILFQTYGEIDPSEDPVLVLPCCSMVYTMATLDGTLQMNTYYDSNGNPVGPLPGGYIDTPQCPNCKKPIR